MISRLQHRKFKTNNTNFDFPDYLREVALKRYIRSRYNNSNLAEVIHENEAVRSTIVSCDSTKVEKRRWMDSGITKEETRSERRGVPTRNRKAARGESPNITQGGAPCESLRAGSDSVVSRVETCRAVSQ